MWGLGLGLGLGYVVRGLEMHYLSECPYKDRTEGSGLGLALE